jgi:hypothetical protein
MGIEDRVATSELPAAAEVGEYVGLDRFAMERMRVRDRRVREAGALAVRGIPLDRE